MQGQLETIPLVWNGSTKPSGKKDEKKKRTGESTDRREKRSSHKAPHPPNFRTPGTNALAVYCKNTRPSATGGLACLDS